MAYAIGVARPVSMLVETFGTETVDNAKHRRTPSTQIFDLRPAAILRDLDLRRPIYKRTAAYGHFGRPADDGGFTWERTDKVDDLALGARALTLPFPPPPRTRPAAPADPTRRASEPSRPRPTPVAGGAGGAGAARPAGHRQDVRLPRARGPGRRRPGRARWCGSHLHGRRVGGWVVAVGVEPPPGRGPGPHRQGDRVGPGARAGRPGRVGRLALGRPAGPAAAHRLARHRGAGAAAPARPRRPAPVTGPVDPLAAEALAAGRAVVRLPPAADPYAARAGRRRPGQRAGRSCPRPTAARHLALRLRRAGIGRGPRAPGLGPGRGRGHR